MAQSDEQQARAELVSDGVQAKASAESRGESTRVYAVAREADPRRLAILMRVVSMLDHPTTDYLFRYLCEDMEWSLANRERGAAGRGLTGGNELTSLRRELQRIGWLTQEVTFWELSERGRQLATKTKQEPSTLALQLCIDSNQHNQQVVTRLLDRLWKLSPENQGMVLTGWSDELKKYPLPETQEELSSLLYVQSTELLLHVKSFCPGWPEVVPRDVTPEQMVERAMKILSPHWDRPTSVYRRARLQSVLNDLLLDFLFGDISSPRDIEIWQARMDWAGLSLTARYIGGSPRWWFPVGAFRFQSESSFIPIPGIESDGRTYYCYSPNWDAAGQQFCSILYASYFEQQRREHVEYVSLPAVRDRVCMRMRISNHLFASLLQVALNEAMRGSLSFTLSLEVDRTPAERNRQGASLPILIDGSPRHIIAIRKRQ